MDFGSVDIAGRIRVKLLADAVAEAVYNPPDGSLAYRIDTAQMRFRSGGAWVSPLIIAPVTSVFGRVGAVVSAVGDYSFAQISGTISDAQHGALSGGALHAVATALANGFMSAADFTKLAGIAPGAASALVNWGNNSVGATTTTRYLEPWFDDTLAPISPTQWRPTRSGTARNARVRHNTPAGDGDAIVYTLRQNGVGTALSISLASTASDSAVDADTVAFAAGDLWDVEVTKADGIGTSPTNVLWTMEFAG